MLKAVVQIPALLVSLLAGCDLIFPFEIEARDDLGAVDVDVDGDGPHRADGPVDWTTPPGEHLVTEAALPGDSGPAIDAAPVTDSATPGDSAPPKDTKPAKDSSAKIDSKSVCTPSCSGGDTCCDKGTGYKCYPSSDGCLCDTATGMPCTGPHPICCDKGSGKGYVCYGIAQACLCDPSTGEPCKSPYPLCCDKGFGDKCYDSCP